jgi:hypothetical protein
MGEFLLRAVYWLKLAGHCSEPLRLAMFFYKVFGWLIKLPGRTVNAYREVRDGFRFLCNFPQRMVEGLMRAVVLTGLVAAVGTALTAAVAKIVRPIVVIGFIALVGTALFVAAKGTVRVAGSRLLIT